MQDSFHTSLIPMANITTASEDKSALHLPRSAHQKAASTLLQRSNLLNKTQMFSL